ncbi:XRE family transcriptional regulator [Treponema sp. OMZ 840]|uniref:XRE family transcriptional regulator n=1 Tax=Treponema sp. OMZ 840 TaxID=244313 RepID=UPI003D89E593
MKDAIEMMETYMKPETVKRARIKAERESLTIKLAQLREKQNLTQTQITGFTQTAVSKLEKRKDLKISTLIEYLDSLGMGVEIRAYPKNSSDIHSEAVLLKV